MIPDQKLLSQLGLSDPAALAETAIARLWRVTSPDGPAVLKVYRDGDEQDEGPGLDLMRAWNGRSAARVLARTSGAVVLEYLDGPSLGDLARDRQDHDTARILAEVAQRLSTQSQPVHGLVSLADRCAPLFASHHDPDFARAAALAQSLLAGAPTPVALHGDLHHDNILRGPRGWCVIDPKGVCGDPAYELANAFRNPVGLPQAIRDPDRLRAMLATFATTTGLPPDRLMGWAAVHVCLSLIWDRSTPHADHPDRDLPPLYLSIYEAVQSA